MPFELRPERDVGLHDHRFVATSVEPWLSVEPVPRDLAGRFIEIVYRLSFWDEPVRPVFRFWRGDGGFVDKIAAAPFVGAGIWIGRLPAGTARISVSPTNRLGRFDFRIEQIRPRLWAGLVAQGFRRNPKAARSALLTRFIGWRPESDMNLSWALGGTRLRDYPAWLAPRDRPIDRRDLDRPRFDWAAAPPIHVIVAKGDRADLARTITSLLAQVSPFWTATILGHTLGPQASDPRIGYGSGDASGIVVEQRAGALTTVIEAGDVLVPGALAYVAEQAHRCPDCSFFYGDALFRADASRPRSAVRGERSVPLVQPGWSPRFFEGHPPDGPCFVRDLNSWPEASRQIFIDTGHVQFAATGAPTAPRPLRRILLERFSPPPEKKMIRPVKGPQTASATIVIPTRDHPALLRRVIASIRMRPGHFQIIIIDNGSTASDARTLLQELGRASDVLCLDHPGPFDFSLMCNRAAAASSGDVLVFLNDDTEILSDDWLRRLVAHAMDPSIGAVGAKLTYPDGRLQHIGVLLGMGESAGHFGARANPDDPGWAGRNTTIHEVSAVTAACLAVQRTKFDAVGGFDADHLPVELSDIDLCLKLNARGWQTIVDPAIQLMHEESKSRGGATFRRLDVYDSQRAVFTARWRHILRDDPVFHPGLSLYSWHAALG